MMKRITLTFDDGPNPPYTSKILDILKRYKVKAIFFLLGYNVKLHPKVALRIKNAGHLIGNHSFSHKDLRKLNKSEILSEITKAESIFKDILGLKPVLFRAPYGRYNKKIKDAIKYRGYKIINWSVCPRDWEHPKAKIIAERVISQVKHRSIVLLHDGSNIRQRRSRAQTILSLEIIIKKLKNKKFMFDTNV